MLPMRGLPLRAFVPTRRLHTQELSQDPQLVERLVASLAPNIWEMEDIKKGVLCQLFGGLPKVGAWGELGLQ